MCHSVSLNRLRIFFLISLVLLISPDLFLFQCFLSNFQRFQSVENLEFLIRIVETEEDFYVMFGAIRCLTKLLLCFGSEIADRFIANPGVLPRIVESLTSSNDILRNGFFLSFFFSHILHL